MRPEDSVLRVRRSIHVRAPRSRVWDEFTSFARMNRWWGATDGTPQAGTPRGMHLVAYQARTGGKVEMEVSMDGKPARFGGPIITFDAGRQLTIENDWIPNRGWQAPTFITLRLSDAPGGTLVELFHHGFERVGDDASEQHAGYEQGWGMLQLSSLKRVVEEENVR